MLKKELEKRCAELEKFEEKCSRLEWIIKEMQIMAKRYAHGRMSTAVSAYNEAVQEAIKIGMEFQPDTDGLVFAKDAMFDKEWFDARRNKSTKVITEE